MSSATRAVWSPTTRSVRWRSPTPARDRGDHPHPPHGLRMLTFTDDEFPPDDPGRDRHQAGVAGRGVRRPRRGRAPVDRPDQGDRSYPSQERESVTRLGAASTFRHGRPERGRLSPGRHAPTVSGRTYKGLGSSSSSQRIVAAGRQWVRRKDVAQPSQFSHRWVVLQDSHRVDVSLEPLDEYVVIQPTSDETETRAGLILPASAAAAAACRTGIVTAVGSDVTGIEPGDKVSTRARPATRCGSAGSRSRSSSATT